jgi:hypothetical protein
MLQLEALLMIDREQSADAAAVVVGCSNKHGKLSALNCALIFS